MPRIFAYLVVASLFFAWPGTTNAQNVVVPAGTLLHCTLEEPNLSSATANLGDPILCHLSTFERFGHIIFPRGSYLAGHLEADKEPGHFVGKGYLKLEFDRIGLESSVIPVPSKVIAARGFRVDRQGDIVGHGHAKRDTVEWLLPPLWPWKVLTLPARGPRPELKGEEPMTLRLMDDIEVPRMTSLRTPDRPPYAYRSQSSDRLPSLDHPPRQPLTQPADNVSGITYLPPSLPTLADESGVAVTLLLHPSPAEWNAATGRKPLNLTLIALKSDTILAVASYRIDSDQMNYMRPSGLIGSVSVSEVDWRKTSQLNADRDASLRYKAH
jgi:hypothetical protein